MKNKPKDSGPKTPAQVAAVEKFKALCVSGNVDRNEELDWYDMSIGFFLALGLTETEANEMAIYARYDEGYWE